MRGRRRRKAPARSSSFQRALQGRLERAFLKVRELVATKARKLGRAKLAVGCGEIHFQRRKSKSYSGARSFMHVGHVRSSVCAIRQAAALSDPHLVALFLHEFGHMAGGDTEPEANDWVRRKLGIEIRYRGPLDLQWILPETAEAILA